MPWKDTAGRVIRPTCDGGNVRHWFAVYGIAGVRSPVCVRPSCDALNPRALTADERAEFEHFAGEWLRSKADRLEGRT